MKLIIYIPFLLLSSFFIAHSSSAQPKYEFRAAWIATVDNIDWPSKKGLSTAQQQQEFMQLLDMLKQTGMNAVVVQIRPCADAFYPSPYEPWSEWLTGQQGVAPNPYYDPLAFMIAETHRRGMEFHGWFNPYRAVFNTKTSSIASNSPTRLHPEWFLTYGDKKYFDPGLPEVRNYVTRIIRDVIARYDIDAVHFDDYFYPYRIEGKEFPDQHSYTLYGKNLSKDDWRRSNVDSIIVQLNSAIKSIKPYVKFGISPFGIWRNKDKDVNGSDTHGGQTNYDDLYADILLWLKNGWIDYVAPQLYWEQGHKLADYNTLIDWWSKHAYGKHVYIGHGIYRAGTNKAWSNKSEIPNQLNLLHQYTTIQGSVYFNTRSFITNASAWKDSLQYNQYKYQALIPAMPWIDSIIPPKPQVQVVTKGDSCLLTITQPVNSECIRKIVVYAFNTLDEKSNHQNPKYIYKIIHAEGNTTQISISEEVYKKFKLAVTVLDYGNNESKLQYVR